MRLPPSRLLRTVLVFLSAWFVTAAHAELVWTPTTGWRVEGGALAGLTGAQGRNALDRMNQARDAEEHGNYGRAISNYAKVAKRYPNSIYAPEALYRAGVLYMKRKQFLKSFDSFQQVLSRYPNTRRFNEIVGEQYRIASALLDGARNRIFWGTIPGFKQREKAIDEFEVILANAPYSDYAPLALMNIARGHMFLKQTEEAIDALDRMINTYPQSILAPDAYLKLAQAHAKLVDGPYYDQASTRESITYFTDFMLLYPNDSNVAVAENGLDQMKTMLAESKIKIGDFYFYKRDNYKAARVFYNEAITDYPESKVAGRAKAKLAEVDAKAARNAPPAPGQPAPVKKKRFWIF